MNLDDLVTYTGAIKSHRIAAVIGNTDIAWINLASGSNGTIFIQDIEVREQISESYVREKSYLDKFFRRSSKMVCLKRRGIGSMLMNHFLNLAIETDCKRIVGSVRKEDIESNPKLLDWYAGFGFQIKDPDDECMAYAVVKIEKLLS